MALSTEQAHPVLFLGHSYVRRLMEFVHNSNNHKVDPNFALRDNLEIYFRGIGGSRVQRIDAELPRAARLYSPTIVYLHIGGNDILHDSDDMHWLATQIFRLASRLYTEFGVQQVIVSQLLCRRKARCASFNDLVVQLNQKLESLITSSSHTGLVFWRHRGFWSPSARAALQHDDGIHLNERGSFKYYESCRSALIQALARMNQTLNQ